MKSDFSIKLIKKHEAADILLKYHYLKDFSNGFKSGWNYGLFHAKKGLVGVCIFTGFPVPELAKGMLGLSRDDQKGLFELSRLCLIPDVQESEHNLGSWFVSRCIKDLKKQTDVRVILSYADESFHSGTIYKALNFEYFGLTKEKKDFWIEQEDGSFKKHTRGKTKGVKGEWRPRSRKHRFVILVDKTLEIKWKKYK